MSTELKPCPFCGEAPRKYIAECECLTPGCAIYEVMLSFDEWNTRAESPDPSALRKDRERLEWLECNHQEFADLLYRIGWDSPTDAQWNKLELFLRGIRSTIDQAMKGDQ